METVLERTMTVISAGRAKLRGPAGEGLPPAGERRPVNGHGSAGPDRAPGEGGDGDADRGGRGSASGFFDQDRS
jgi:hypothetical protein